MNQAQARAVRQLIASTEDNLYRYKLQYQRTPEARTGNGEPFTDIIRQLEKQLEELKEGIEQWTTY